MLRHLGVVRKRVKRVRNHFHKKREKKYRLEISMAMAMSMAMTMAIAMANILARVTANSDTVYKRGRQLTIIPKSDQCHGQYLLWPFSLSIYIIKREKDHKSYWPWHWSDFGLIVSCLPLWKFQVSFQFFYILPLSGRPTGLPDQQTAQLPAQRTT